MGADVAEAFGDEGVDGCFGEKEGAVVVELSERGGGDGVGEGVGEGEVGTGGGEGKVLGRYFISHTFFIDQDILP